MKKGFTLIELLIVVLIIGVLTAVALPMYQGAVDKSHFSTLLPAARAIKTAEEAFMLANGTYTDEMSELDVSMENADVIFILNTTSTSEPNAVRATTSKLPGVRLASYLDKSPMFAGQMHCEAETGNERAQKLCEKLLGGQELTSSDGYTGYLLDQEIDQATCSNASRSWSSSKGKCYKDTATRCSDLGLPVLESTDYPDQCGTDGKGNIQAEEACLECWNAFIEPGGVCLSYEHPLYGCREDTVQGAIVCNGTSVCGIYSIFDGGVCIANSSSTSQFNCYVATFTNNSVCFANTPHSCGSTFKDTSCCCGDYCGNNPKCDVSRCNAVREQYAQYFND